MQFRTGYKKIISCLLLTVFIPTQVLFAHRAESNVWTERKSALKQFTLASLPLSAPISQFNAVSHGNFRSADSITPHSPTIYFIEDIHGHAEAQKNINSIVRGIIEQFPNVVVGLEGTSGTIDLAEFRGPDAGVNRQIGEFLFDAGAVSGVEAALLGSPRAAVAVGLEDVPTYLKNVTAVKTALRQQPAALREIQRARNQLASQSRSVYSAALLKLENQEDLYQQGKIPLADYLVSLDFNYADGGSFPMLRLFQKLIVEESTLNFALAERQRNDFVARMVQKLSPEKLNQLVKQTAELKSGRLSYPRYHEMMRQWANEVGLSWEGAAEFKRYLTYISQADSIRTDRLLEELAQLENATWNRLAQTPAQKKHRAAARTAYLTEQLIKLSLTRAQWQELQLTNFEPRMSNIGSFKDFYRLAEERNQFIAAHMAAALKEHRASVGVVVAGGFHSAELKQLFRHSKINVVTVTPKLTAADALDGTPYLAVFTRDRTPLEKLFESPRLSLVNSPGLKSLTQPGQTEGLRTAALEARTVLPIAEKPGPNGPVSPEELKSVLANDPAARDCALAGTITREGKTARGSFTTPRPNTLIVEPVGQPSAKDALLSGRSSRHQFQMLEGVPFSQLTWKQRIRRLWLRTVYDPLQEQAFQQFIPAVVLPLLGIIFARGLGADPVVQAAFGAAIGLVWIEANLPHFVYRVHAHKNYSEAQNRQLLVTLRLFGYASLAVVVAFGLSTPVEPWALIRIAAAAFAVGVLLHSLVGLMSVAIPSIVAPSSTPESFPQQWIDMLYDVSPEDFGEGGTVVRNDFFEFTRSLFTGVSSEVRSLNDMVPFFAPAYYDTVQGRILPREPLFSALVEKHANTIRRFYLDRPSDLSVLVLWKAIAHGPQYFTLNALGGYESSQYITLTDDPTRQLIGPNGLPLTNQDIDPEHRDHSVQLLFAKKVLAKLKEDFGLAIQTTIIELNQDSRLSTDMGTVAFNALVSPDDRFKFSSNPNMIEILQGLEFTRYVVHHHTGWHENRDAVGTITRVEYKNEDAGYDARVMFPGVMTGGLAHKPEGLIRLALPLKEYWSAFAETFGIDRPESVSGQARLQAALVEQYVRVIRFLSQEHGIPGEKTLLIAPRDGLYTMFWDNFRVTIPATNQMSFKDFLLATAHIAPDYMPEVVAQHLPQVDGGAAVIAFFRTFIGNSNGGVFTMDDLRRLNLKYHEQTETDKQKFNRRVIRLLSDHLLSANETPGPASVSKSPTVFAINGPSVLDIDLRFQPDRNGNLLLVSASAVPGNTGVVATKILADEGEEVKSYGLIAEGEIEGELFQAVVRSHPDIYGDTELWKGSSRSSLFLSDPQGRLAHRLRPTPPALDRSKIRGLAHRILRKFPVTDRSEVIVVGGQILGFGQGVALLCARIVRSLGRRGYRVVASFKDYQSPLEIQSVLRGRPTVAKLNSDQLASLVSKEEQELIDHPHLVAQMAAELAAINHIPIFIVTMGKNGAVVVYEKDGEEHGLHAICETSSQISPVGAGDTFLGGFISALATAEKGKPVSGEVVELALRRGTAAGAAASLKPVTESPSKAEIDAMFPQVHITEINRILPGKASTWETPSPATIRRVISGISKKLKGVWMHQPLDVQSDIVKWLGWFSSPGKYREQIDEINAFRDEVFAENVKHVVLIGTGGSALGAKTLTEMLERQPGAPDLSILDLTHPDALDRVQAQIEDDLEHTLFVIGSKSGGTLDTVLPYRYFRQLMGERLGKEGAALSRHFVAICDPGKRINANTDAEFEAQFRRVFRNDPEIGGRFSVFSYFGLLPAALAGVDIAPFLESGFQAQMTAHDRAERLRLVLDNMVESLREQRDKFVFVLDGPWAPLGPWLQQLLNESWGKKSDVPIVVTDSPSPLNARAHDRLLVRFDRTADGRPDFQPLTKLLKQLTLSIVNPSELGAVMFDSMLLTAIMGDYLEVHPFNQPGVQMSKTLTEQALEGNLPQAEPAYRSPDGEVSIYFDDSVKRQLEKKGLDLTRCTPTQLVNDFIGGTPKRGYAAILAYEDETIAPALYDIRREIEGRFKLLTVGGIGPRYEHSDNQLYSQKKGNMVVMTFDVPEGGDRQIPGEEYTFGELTHAKARANFATYQDQGSPAIHIHMSRRYRDNPELLEALFKQPAPVPAGDPEAVRGTAILQVLQAVEESKRQSLTQILLEGMGPLQKDLAAQAVDFAETRELIQDSPQQLVRDQVVAAVETFESGHTPKAELENLVGLLSWSGETQEATVEAIQILSELWHIPLDQETVRTVWEEQKRERDQLVEAEVFDPADRLFDDTINAFVLNPADKGKPGWNHTISLMKRLAEQEERIPLNVLVVPDSARDTDLRTLLTEEGINPFYLASCLVVSSGRVVDPTAVRQRALSHWHLPVKWGMDLYTAYPDQINLRRTDAETEVFQILSEARAVSILSLFSKAFRKIRVVKFQA